MFIAKPRLIQVLPVLLGLLLAGTGCALAQPITFQFVETEYRDVFQTIGEIAGLNVLVDESVAGTGSFNFQEVEFEEALDIVAGISGADYVIKNNTLMVAAEERLAEIQANRVFYLHTSHVAPQQLIPVLSMVMPAENIYALNDSNLLILFGSLEQFDMAQEIVCTLDIPAPKAYQQESVLDVLEALTEELGLNLIADPSLTSRRVVFSAPNLEPAAALESVAQMANLEYYLENGTLVVQPKAAADRNSSDLGEKIKVFRLNYADPVVTGSMLQLIIPADKIQIDESTKSVMIRATEKQIAEVDQFMADYDRPVPQVLMEVWIHEVSDDVSNVFGLGWNGSLPGARVGGGDPEDLFHIELDWEPWEIIFALDALEKEGKAKILASPKIAALSGEEATIFVGDQIPIVLTDEEGEQRIEFLESGINLRVRPRISEDGFITIDVSPEASLFIFTEEGEYPQIRTRQARTTVRVKDGQPVLIGGLIQEQDGQSVNKIPLLGDLPILGRLFQKTISTTERTEMSIILIPRIVDGEQGLVGGTFFPAAR